jgi:hypothetical protein
LDKNVESVNSKGTPPKLRTRNPNRVSLLLALATVSLSLIWLVASKYVGPPLVEKIYHGDSLPILNRMISGQASHPLAEYLAALGGLRWRVFSDLYLFGLLVVLVFRPEFQQSLWRPAAPNQEGLIAASYVNYLYLVLAIAAAYLLYFSLGVAPSPYSVRFFFDRYLFDPDDLSVYFKSSAWAVGKGKLYLDVPSEYPVLANLVFGSIRFLSSKIRLLSSDFYNFSLMWIVCASVPISCFLSALQNRKVDRGSWFALLLLVPAAIYFSLFRFDIYPALFSFWGLDHLRERKWNIGALLLGVCIALKGYALILVPSFFVFCWCQIGLGPALVAVVVMLSPTLVSNFAVFVWGGKEALLAPYKLQLFRGFNGESSFDSLFFIGSRLGISATSIATMKSSLLEHQIPKLIQSAIAMGACFFRPARFESFVNAAFLSVLGFMAFSSFYSPQFVLWLIPFLLFTRDRALLSLGVLLAFCTYIYFPVSYDIRASHRTFFALSVLLVTSIRFFMMARLIKLLGAKENPAEETRKGSPDLRERITGIA